MNTFICATCGAPHATLRDLLQCHPRELRRATGELGAKKANAHDLRRILCGPSDGQARRAARVK
jgi:hypothetical protein